MDKKRNQKTCFFLLTADQKKIKNPCKKGSTLRRKGMKYDYRKAVKEDVKKYIEVCKWYDDTAKAMCGGYEERRKQLKRLIKAFIEDVSTERGKIK